MNATTAILIFSRTATAEAGRKEIAGNSRNNVAAHAFLLNKTLATVEGSSLPHFHIDEKKQCGVTFEERLHDAIKQVFKQGYENILCVGSDCPQLTSDHLLQSKIAVENGTACFGKDGRGGVYLIAISSSQFKAGILNSISWNTNKVFSQIQANTISLALNYDVLSVCRDINNKQDLLQYIKTKEISQSLRWALALVLGIGKQFSNIIFQQIINVGFKGVNILRGPPAYC